MITKFSSNSESQYFIPISTNPLISTKDFPSSISKTKGFKSFIPKPFLGRTIEKENETQFCSNWWRVDLLRLLGYQVKLDLFLFFFLIGNGLCLLPFLRRDFSLLIAIWNILLVLRKWGQKKPHPHNNNSSASVLPEINSQTKQNVKLKFFKNQQI